MERLIRSCVLTGLLSIGGLSTSCAPAVDAGECSEGSPCPRGEMCNLDQAVCELVDLPTDATEAMAGANFTGKVFPFFRGRVCTVTETISGQPFPIYMSPCVHPCLDVSTFQFKHSWTCSGSSCDAYAVMWMTADGTACPEDTFGQFAANQCVYDTPINLTIDPVYGDGTVVQGTMEFEIPFLSNEDAAVIANGGGDLGTIEARIDQYPQDPARIVGGAPISILGSNPAPPAECGADGRNCNCFDIGF